MQITLETPINDLQQHAEMNSIYLFNELASMCFPNLGEDERIRVLTFINMKFGEVEKE